MLASPVIAKIIEDSVASGEDARILPRVPTKFKMADGRVVLAPLTPSGMGGALLIRAEPIVAVFRQLFETLWKRASPLGRPSAKAAMFSPVQQDILRYLSEGLDRHEIAERLERHVNTVDRNLNIIMDKLGVETWFAAGMVAVRKGLIE
jgi:DNA-binding CsgD family transcriptional regulator